VRYYKRRNEPAVSVENLLMVTVTSYYQGVFFPWGWLIIYIDCLFLVSSSGLGLFPCIKVAVGVSKPQYPNYAWALLVKVSVWRQNYFFILAHPVYKM